MRRVMAAMVLFALVAVPAAAQTSKPAAKPIVVKAARMFDGKGDRVVMPGLVVVADGKIVAVGAGAIVPADAEVIELGDATLLPGCRRRRRRRRWTRQCPLGRRCWPGSQRFATWGRRILWT